MNELAWFKSSYSDSSGSACLEVAYTSKPAEAIPNSHIIHVRDSKLGAQSPRFAVPAQAWTAFLAYAREGSVLTGGPARS